MCDIRLLKHGLGHRGHTFDERTAYRLQAGVINLQSHRRAGEVGKVHYDFGNDLLPSCSTPLCATAAATGRDWRPSKEPIGHESPR